MTRPAEILVVDDNKGHAEIVAEALEGIGHHCRVATTGQAAMRLVRAETFDCIVTDLVMHGVDGIEVLQAVKRTTPETEVILMTAHGTIETAVKAMELGAFTFITKPVDLGDIRMRVGRALERAGLRREVRDLRAMVDERYGFEGIVGNSPLISKIIDDLRTVAPSRLAILITGEPGTGKELIAKAIHQNSDRRDQRFVPINCSMLVGPLLESELFGHTKGAFTGADRDREGRFAYADGGTLFLDEIGDLPIETQAKLLRVLQDGNVTRLGSNKLVAVDVRFLSATNKDLREEIEKGRFREDLYSRIHGLELHVPPLRERKQDVPLLAQHFLGSYASEAGRDVEGFTPDALGVLIQQHWEGNVRELQQFCQGLVLFARGPQIGREEVVAHLERTIGANRVVLPAATSAGTATTTSTPAGAVADLFPDATNPDTLFELLLTMPLPDADIEGGVLRAVEKGLLQAALRYNRGNRKKTAAMLGLSERTVYRRLEEYGIE